MKILVSKPDSLGDQIIAAGFVQQLSREHPDASIIWHIRPQMKAIASLIGARSVFELDFTSNPATERDRFNKETGPGIHLLPVPIDPCADWSPETESVSAFWFSFLGSISWDLAITALRNRTWLSELSVLATRAPRRIALEKTNAWQPLAEKLAPEFDLDGTFYTEELAFSRQESEYESLERLFAACTDQANGKEINLIYPPPSTHGDRNVLFAPGVGFQPLRSWPIDKWIHLSQLLEETGYSVSWIQGPGDERFYAGHPVPQHARITFGADELPELASRIAGAHTLVCNDSSYVHLGASIGTPTIAFFGCGQDKRFIPSRGQVKVIQGVTIEAGSQWHNHCDIWASIREIPVSSAVNAFEALTHRNNTETVTVPIEVDCAIPELSDPKTRAQFLDNHQRQFWARWSADQFQLRKRLLS